jgi:hypothetical protein
VWLAIRVAGGWVGDGDRETEGVGVAFGVVHSTRDVGSALYRHLDVENVTCRVALSA